MTPAVRPAATNGRDIERSPSASTGSPGLEPTGWFQRDYPVDDLSIALDGLALAAMRSHFDLRDALESIIRQQMSYAERY